jgi:hypothetical protein
MRSADAACLKLSDRDRVIEYRRALRHALEEKWKWELYFDAADAVATKAVQRAEKAERERDQWYKLSGQPVQSLEAENTELREALREAVEWVESPGPGPPDLGPRRDRWNQIRLLTEEPEPMDRPVPSVDAEMARIWDDAKRGTQSRTEAADNYTKGLEDALRKALEEKQKWERYFDAADDVATKAVQRAEQAEREREQYIKGGWYEEYQKRLDALLAENTELREALRRELREALRRLAPYSSEEPTR